jgi:dsDNA-specific endonuclease/ATPase MutS2
MDRHFFKLYKINKKLNGFSKKKKKKKTSKKKKANFRSLEEFFFFSFNRKVVSIPEKKIIAFLRVVNGGTKKAF